MKNYMVIVAGIDPYENCMVSHDKGVVQAQSGKEAFLKFAEEKLFDEEEREEIVNEYGDGEDNPFIVAMCLTDASFEETDGLISTIGNEGDTSITVVELP